MRKILTNCSGYYRSDMQGYDRLLIPTTEKIVDNTIKINDELLLVRPMSNESMLTLSDGNDRSSDRNIINNAILLASNDHLTVRFMNEWMVEKFPLSQISTLFCFLDYQTKNCESGIGKMKTLCQDKSESDKESLETERNIILLLDNTTDRLMDILISGIINPQKQSLQCIYTFIRNMESYWIAYFLLSQVFEGENDNDAYKLYNACKVYGVSESYFRKLCHNAFTCGPKKQLRMWRAAHSALQLIEKDKSIATIAGNNGYSSSSHFSSEIKSIFGITPREFKKLEGLLHD